MFPELVRYDPKTTEQEPEFPSLRVVWPADRSLAGRTVQAGEGQYVSKDQMESLKSLMRHVGVIYTETVKARTVGDFERKVWVTLVGLALLSGTLFGASLLGWSAMGPVMAVAGCLIVVTLVATLLRWSHVDTVLGPYGRRR